jgi:small subunit ribosomal protein S10
MKLRIFLKSFHKERILQASNDFLSLFAKIPCEKSGWISLPVKTKKFCVLRSPHIDKDSREHFELRIYKKFVDISIESMDHLDPLFTLQLPSGVVASLKVL